MKRQKLFTEMVMLTIVLPAVMMFGSQAQGAITPENLFDLLGSVTCQEDNPPRLQ